MPDACKPTARNAVQRMHTMATKPTTTPAPALEPVNIRFTVREKDGETIVATDSLTGVSVAGAYDAVRIRAIANENDDKDTAATMTSFIVAAKPRAVEAAKLLAHEAAKRQVEAFKPGGDRKTRAEAQAALRACLRAYRVAKA